MRASFALSAKTLTQSLGHTHSAVQVLLSQTLEPSFEGKIGMKFASVRKQAARALRLLAPTLLIGAMGSTALGVGTDLSGGGTSAEVQTASGQTERVLLDFVNFGQVPTTRTPGFKFERTRAYKKLGVEKLDLEKTPFYSDLVNRFKLFERRSPLFVKYLTQAARNVAIYYTPYRFAKVEPTTYFADPSRKESLKPRPVALFTTGFGILVSVPEVEDFAYESQRGLFAHEIMRHLQLSYGFRMTDKTVQSVVNLLLNADPEKVPSFDSEAFFGATKWREQVVGIETTMQAMALIMAAPEWLAKYSSPTVDLSSYDLSTGPGLQDAAKAVTHALWQVYARVSLKVDECKARGDEACAREAADDLGKHYLATMKLENFTFAGVFKSVAINPDYPKFIAVAHNANRLIEKYSGQMVKVDPTKMTGPDQLHTVVSQLRSALVAIYPAIVQRLEDCRAANESGCYDEAAKDSDQRDLAFSQLRNISLDTIMSGFNTITDDLRDRTTLLQNARLLELQIECANKFLCDLNAFESSQGNPFQALLGRGELLK